MCEAEVREVNGQLTTDNCQLTTLGGKEGDDWLFDRIARIRRSIVRQSRTAKNCPHEEGIWWLNGRFPVPGKHAQGSSSGNSGHGGNVSRRGGDEHLMPELDAQDTHQQAYPTQHAALMLAPQTIDDLRIKQACPSDRHR